MNPVEQAIAAAQQQASNTPSPSTASTSNLPAVNDQGSTAVSMPAMAGAPLSMETIGSGGMSVDHWLKVKDVGLLIGDDKTIFDKIKVKLDMTDKVGFMVKFSMKAGQNPVQYYSTYDGQVSNNGKPWAEAVAELKRIDPKATPYRSVDLPFILLEDLKDKKGVVLASAGQRLGYSTSTTNWPLWENFHREVNQKGLLGMEVDIELGCIERKKGTNSWGVVSFKLEGPSGEGE